MIDREQQNRGPHPDEHNCINDECEEFDLNKDRQETHDPSAVPLAHKSQDERAAEAARGRYTSESDQYARSNDTERENLAFRQAHEKEE